MLFIFTILVTSCKEEVAGEKVEEGIIAIGEENSGEDGEIIDSSETKDETPPVVEEELQKTVEWKGITINPIEGLRFDKGTFYAEAGNPYGLEEGEKAGVAIPNAVEINGVMESAIGLRPEVIEVIQKEITEEEKKFAYPFIIDLEQTKADLRQDQVIKIREVANESLDGWAKEEGTFWDKSFNIEISNIPLDTLIYSPVNTPPGEYTFFPYNLESRKDYYNFIFGIDLSIQGELYRGIDKISRGGIGIEAIGIKLLPEGIEDKMVYDLAEFPLYSSDINMGIPIAQIISKEYLDDKYWDKKETPTKPVDEPSISISYGFNQLRNPDKYLETGLENLLKLGKEEIPVFISPDYE
jgi:hypothetical protein